MTDIRRTGNFNSVATMPEPGDDAINLMQKKDPEAELLQMMASLPEAGARALLERFKQEKSIPPEILKKAEEYLNGQQAQGSQPSNGGPVLYSDAASTQRRAEVGQGAMLQQIELQKRFATKSATSPQKRQPVSNQASAPATGSSASVQQAKATVQSNFAEVQEMGRSIAEGKGPLSEEEKKAWEAGQEKLRQSVTELGAKVAQLPMDSPEREAARAELAEMSKQLTAMELPALARMDPEFAKSWNEHHSTVPGSDGAALPTRMKMYGITEEQMNEYITTGKEAPGLSKAIADAKRTGDWPALGVVRAAFQQRADYLRATSPKEDTASQKHAADLDAAATSLTRNRGNIQLNWASNTYSRLASKYPDESKRPEIVKTQMKEAKNAIASVGKNAAEQVEKHPERYGKNSATRRLAGDAMATEAGIMDTEAKKVMQEQAKKLDETTKAQGDPKVVPPPPALHPDLVEGGAVDKKREAAVKIDPSLGDVVNGGDRAVKFARDTMQTKKLRLGIDEQQVAHIKSKNQDPPPQLEAKVNKQLDSVFKSALETNQKLVSQKPGSLSLAQTQLLAETGRDANTYSNKLSVAERQKKQIESAHRLANQGENEVNNTRIALDGKYEAFEKQKIDRVRQELAIKRSTEKNGFEEYAKFDKNPAEYIKTNNIPDNKEEAELRGLFNEAYKGVNEQLTEAKQRTADSKAAYDHSKKVDDLDGLNTPPEMATKLAADALKASEAHLKVIPEKGPERLPRMQALMDHQSAVIGVNRTIRDNADAKMERTKLEHQQTLQAFAGVTHHTGENPVEVSKANLAKITADGMQAKQEAFDAAKAAGAESEKTRQSINKELDVEQSKLPKNVQQQRAAGVQEYKDSLAVQQVRTQGAIAEMGADVNPKESLAQLDLGNKIVKEELPVAQVARLDKKQAAIDHARNEARADALATVGEAGIVVARRAQTKGGIEYGTLVVDALDRAGSSGVEAHRTLTIDGGGAAEATANKEFHKEMKSRADGIQNSVMEINKSADVEALADKIDKEVVKDLEDFNDQYSKMSKAVKDQRSGAFGFLFSAGARLRGIDINKEGVEAGLVGLKYAASNAKAQVNVLKMGTEQLREMRRQGIPDHVIMASLRDPRLGTGILVHGEAQYRKDVGGWRDDFNAGIKRFGSKMEVNAHPFNVLRSETPLGRVLETANSNRTDRIVDFIGNKHTDLLSRNKGELEGQFNAGQKQWRDAAPYVMLSNLPDQALLAVGSSYAMAGVFARAASFTRIPQAFNAMRGAAAGMSVPARLAVLTGVNAAEAGLGMITGEAISKTGTAVFGKNSFGAKAFDVIGSGFQLSVGSAVALRSGLGFQAAMGLTMNGVPIAAQQLGASPELAAKIGMATGAFVPTVLGTMGNLKTLKRSEGVLVNELGIDPKQAKSLMGDVFHAESHNGGGLNVEAFTRERAGKLLDARLPQLGADARANLLDTMTLDSIRKRIPFEPPKSLGAEQLAKEVQNHFGKIQAELINKGVAPERAKQLAEAEKTAMYDEALTKINRGAETDVRPVMDGSPEGAVASTRAAVQDMARSMKDPLPDVEVLRTVRAQGQASGQQADSGYKLVRMDRDTNTAWVMGPDGSVRDVPAQNVVYVHDHQSLGLLKPAIKKKFEDNFAALGDKDKKDFGEMMQKAREKSPEHAHLLRKLLAGGGDMDTIKDMHAKTLKMSQEEIGAFFAPGNLPQHLMNSCAAACIQRIEALLSPLKAHELKDKGVQAFGQLNKLHNNHGGSAPRTDANYPNLMNPPLKPYHWVPAQHSNHHPEAVDHALSSENRNDHSVYDVGRLDRRYLPEHLEHLADAEGAILHSGGDEDGVTYELKGFRNTANGKEVQIRVIGQQDTAWIPASQLQPDPQGKIVLPNGKALTYIAAPSDVPIKAANKGMNIEGDANFLNMIRATTGKGIRTHEVGGDTALRALYDSVNDIGLAGVSVNWRGSKVHHALLVVGAKLKNGEYQFDVFDPKFGKARTVSGKDLLAYNDGNNIGDLKYVQVPDDMKIAKPAAGEVPSPDKTGRFRYEAEDGMPMDQAIASLEVAKGPMDIDAVLAATVPGFATADTQTRENLINMVIANPDPGARRALLEIAPLLTDVPPSISGLMQQQLYRMNPSDITKVAERLRNAKQPNWDRASDEEALQFSNFIFGR